MQPEFRRRAGFIVDLARRLHQYGTSASRFEMAISQVSERLGLRTEVWSSPTAIILSFYDPEDGENGLANLTQMLRLPPGDVNLRKLCLVDDIADQVVAGEVDVREGRRLMQALDEPPGWLWKLAMVLSYGLAAGCLALLFRAAWTDALVAGALGLVPGLLVVASADSPRLAQAVEALSAFLVTLLAIVVAALIMPLGVKPVVTAALIVLIPGMSLTTVVRELSTQHLMSGMARLAGSTASMLKLVFGVAAAFGCAELLGLAAGNAALVPAPAWLDWPAAVLAALAFAVFFQAAWRDWPAVILAVVLGFAAARFAGEWFGPVAGVFAGGVLLGAAGNAWARWAQRPGAIIREPGIILLVPGSVGFRSLSYFMDDAVGAGTDTGVLLVKLLIGLVAGLLVGDALIAARRNL